MRTADGRTAYVETGNGEALVLAHGVGMGCSFWAPQVEAFAGSHRVVAYDLLGHGRSALPSPEPTLAEYGNQLVVLLDDLGIERANLVGHSMGALVVLDVALRHPDRVLRVAALNAVHERPPDQATAVAARAAALANGDVQGSAEAAIVRWFGNPIPAGQAAAALVARRALENVDPVGYARAYGLFARADRIHADRLRELRVPALFMTGEDDPNSTPAMARAMAGLAPCGEPAVLPGQRHLMSLVSPADVNERLAAFLARPAAPCGDW
ncbi:MAG: alpha/beta fold hydrolase [Chloroflexota bacterium]|nr:alpha/beta fold hydrolase [Chloroflexota bacterium]